MLFGVITVANGIRRPVHAVGAMITLPLRSIIGEAFRLWKFFKTVPYSHTNMETLFTANTYRLKGRLGLSRPDDSRLDRIRGDGLLGDIYSQVRKIALRPLLPVGFAKMISGSLGKTGRRSASRSGPVTERPAGDHR